MRSLPALLTICVVSFATACGSAPTPVKRSLDEEASTDHGGLPAEWRPWIGFDRWKLPPPINWDAYLTTTPTRSGKLSLPGEAAIFEIRFIEGETLRRWYVRLRTDPEGSLMMYSATLTYGDDGRVVGVPLAISDSLVSVAADGGDTARERKAKLPMIAAGLGFTVGSATELEEAFARLEAAGEVTPEVEDQRVVAMSQPTIALFTIFQALQKHDELSSILRQVVSAPSLLSIIRSGGIRLVLEADTENTQQIECSIGRQETVPGVSFPASISVNGKPALVMQIHATESMRPFHLTGGLVGLRASRPDDESRYVELRLIGARRVSGRP